MCLNKNKSANDLPCFRLIVLSSVVNSAGLRGLCRGLGITFTREAPAFGIYFGSYEVMIRYRIKRYYFNA